MSTAFIPISSPRRFAATLTALLLSTTWAGCAEPLPADVATETSNLFIQQDVTAYPYRDARVTFSDCCNAPWTIVSGGNRLWSSLNEARCNSTADYISVNNLGDFPYYGGAAVEMNLDDVPIGAHVTDVRAVVCARPHVKTVRGNFKAAVHYWDPDARGHVYLRANRSSDIYAPAVGSSAENLFSLMEIETKPSASDPASTTPKTDTSGMRFYLFGDNLDVSQIFLKLRILTPAITPPPGVLVP
jgi:hypothetical protein